MAKILKTKSLNWSNVNLIAQHGQVKSRQEIPIEGERIVVSAMTSIIGPTFIEAVSKLPYELQPTLHIPRDIFKVENINLCKQLKLKNIFIGVGLNEDKVFEHDVIYNTNYKIAFLDIANGYLPQIYERVKQLKEKGFEKVICGSVHSQEGFKKLAYFDDVDIVRSGIAPGSVCITSDSTGFTRGTFTEIHEMYQMKVSENIPKSIKEDEKYPYIKILADGGIKSPSDCVKAFLAGADYVMGGFIFTKAKECRMHQDWIERKIFLNDVNDDNYFPQNTYFGMASFYGKVAMGQNKDEVSNIEGKEKIIEGPYLTLKFILETIWDGIRSGVSYSGYKTLTEAIGNGVFEIIG